jgi:hypothetical protein
MHHVAVSRILDQSGKKAGRDKSWPFIYLVLMLRIQQKGLSARLVSIPSVPNDYAQVKPDPEVS